MLDIPIDDKYKLKSDKYSFLLVETVKSGKEAKNPGEEMDRILGSYGSVEGVLRGYKQIKGKTANSETFKDLVKVMKEVDKKIKKICQEIGL